jgi:ribosomal protein S18 acetylase RimI-like enzyme
MKTLNVRRAHSSDLEALARLFDDYRQFYGCSSDVPAARKYLLERFTNEESVLFIALEGERSVGFAQLYPSFSSLSLARIFILNDLYVSPEGRRKGVGTQLLHAVDQYAKERGAVRLTLSTAATNLPAQALYRSEGWKKDEQFVVYWYDL